MFIRTRAIIWVLSRNTFLRFILISNIIFVMKWSFKIIIWTNVWNYRICISLRSWGYIIRIVICIILNFWSIIIILWFITIISRYILLAWSTSKPSINLWLCKWISSNKIFSIERITNNFLSIREWLLSRIIIISFTNIA